MNPALMPVHTGKFRIQKCLHNAFRRTRSEYTGTEAEDVGIVVQAGKACIHRCSWLRGCPGNGLPQS